MRYLPLGSSGLKVSAVGLGCNNFGGRLDAQATRSVVDAALDAGITLLDTADIYGGAGGSETHLGQALKGRRDQVVLATKFGYDGVDMGYGPAAGSRGGRGYIRRAVEESLRRLDTDHIDLYQLHSPDPATPVAETLAALTELVTEGKIRYIGHSNLSGWQLAEAAHVARETGAVPFVSAQNEWSLLQRSAERELVPAAVHYGLGVLPYFPLANGLLTGKIRRGAPVPACSAWKGATPTSPRSASTRWRPWWRSPRSTGAPFWSSPSAGSPPSPAAPRSSPGPPPPTRYAPTRRWPTVRWRTSCWPRSTPSRASRPDGRSVRRPRITRVPGARCGLPPAPSCTVPDRTGANGAEPRWTGERWTGPR
ncbi:hypothetical protein SLAVM298S_03379 [Streptomyces lavendulae subsp. lavendulae]